MKKNSFKFTPLTVIVFTLLTVYAAGIFVPLFWGLMSSVKSPAEFDGNALGFPQKITFSNFVTTFKNIKHTEQGVTTYFPQMFLNSILYAGGCAIIAAFTPMLVAYATTKFNFSFNRIIDAIVIVVLVLPVVGSQASELMVARATGVYDRIFGQWIMKMSFVGIYYLVYKASFQGVAKDFSEAAFIDGANEWQVMTAVMIPLAKQTLFTVMLLKFIEFWNDYQTPLLFIPSYPTVSYGIYEVSMSSDMEINAIPVQLSACFLMLIPVLILFICFSKRLIGNVTMGGIKG